MNEIIERAAKAICIYNTRMGREFLGRSEKQNWALLKDIYREEARIVFATALEPTEAMTLAPCTTGGEPYKGPSPKVWGEAWRMMIDEILK